jgi:hypothetical protein
VTASDLATVLVAAVALGASAALAVTSLMLVRTTRDLATALDQMHDEVLPVVAELRDTVVAAGHEVERVDRLLESAEAISATVEGASRLGYAAFTRPVIRTVAVVQGTGRGLRRVGVRPARRRRVSTRQPSRDAVASPVPARRS